MSYQPTHPHLIIPLQMPSLVVFQRPEKVRVWVDEDHQTGLILGDTSWQKLKLDLRDFRGQTIYIRFRTKYAFFPFFYNQNPD